MDLKTEMSYLMLKLIKRVKKFLNEKVDWHEITYDVTFGTNDCQKTFALSIVDYLKVMKNCTNCYLHKHYWLGNTLSKEQMEMWAMNYERNENYDLKMTLL